LAVNQIDDLIALGQNIENNRVNLIDVMAGFTPGSPDLIDGRAVSGGLLYRQYREQIEKAYRGINDVYSTLHPDFTHANNNLERLDYLQLFSEFKTQIEPVNTRKFLFRNTARSPSIPKMNDVYTAATTSNQNQLQALETALDDWLVADIRSAVSHGMGNISYSIDYLETDSKRDCFSEFLGIDCECTAQTDNFALSIDFHTNPTFDGAGTIGSFTLLNGTFTQNYRDINKEGCPISQVANGHAPNDLATLVPAAVQLLQTTTISPQAQAKSIELKNAYNRTRNKYFQSVADTIYTGSLSFELERLDRIGMIYAGVVRQVLGSDMDKSDGLYYIGKQHARAPRASDLIARFGPNPSPDTVQAMVDYALDDIGSLRVYFVGANDELYRFTEIAKQDLTLPVEIGRLELTKKYLAADFTLDRTEETQTAEENSGDSNPPVDTGVDVVSITDNPVQNGAAENNPDQNNQAQNDPVDTVAVAADTGGGNGCSISRSSTQLEVSYLLLILLFGTYRALRNNTWVKGRRQRLPF